MTLASHTPSFNHYDQNGPVRRAGEYLPRLPERSQRLVSEDGRWYYSARECDRVGPYCSRENAEKASRTYIRFCRNLNVEHLHTLIQQHMENLRSLSQEESGQPLRDGEMEVPASRQERVSKKDGQWFFSTREGEMVGPYENKAAAREASDTFMQFVVHVDRKMIGQLISTMNAEAGGSDYEEAVYDT